MFKQFINKKILYIDMVEIGSSTNLIQQLDETQKFTKQKVNTDLSINIERIDNSKNKYARIPDSDIVEIQSQKKSKTQKLWTFGGIAAGLTVIGTIAALLIKGKIATAKRVFAEHIDFVPAKTIEEAKEFAKTHFGINHFNLDGDIEMANWVNEGLVRINNFYKGKAPIPRKVKPYPKKLHDKTVKEGKNPILADMNPKNGTLRINLNYFNSAGENIQKYIDALGFKVKKRPDGLFDTQFDILPFLNIEKQQSLIPLLVEIEEGTATKMDLVAANITLYDMYHYANLLNESPELIYKMVLKSPKLQNLAKNNTKIKLVSLEDFNKLSKDDKIDYFYELSNLFMEGHENKELISLFSDIKIADRPTDIFQTMFHEDTHWFHRIKLGFKKFVSLRRKKFTKEEELIAKTVSTYAVKNPLEFVAEVNAMILSGYKPSEEVMKLYKKFGGPLIGDL